MSDRSGPASGPPESWSTDAFDPETAEDQFRAALSGRFEIEREVGRGGAGIVYLALDRVRGERVALKALRPELAASVGIARFAQEVEIGRALDHPNIVAILDSGTAAGRLYCTMPFIEGKTLRDRLRAEGQLSVNDAFDIARQLAAALDYAHAHPLHVVHRDLKPANVLLSGKRALLADFGIARALTTSSAGRLTESGIALGTVEYMSPEQVEARKDVDRRADIYALGCVVFEMLAGEPPFTGPTSQAVQARTLHEAPRSLRIVRPNVSRAADAAIARALAKVPADRFATAGEFVEALSGPELAAAEPGRGVRNTSRWVAVTAASIAAAALAIWDVRRDDGVLARAGLIAPRLDTNTYLVAGVDSAAETEAAADLIRGTLAAINGITVVSPIVVAEADKRGRRGDGRLPIAALARHLRAGRHISVRAKADPDSVTVLVALGAAIGDTTLATEEVRSAVDPGAWRSKTAAAVMPLLVRGPRPRNWNDGNTPSTTSRGAYRAYLDGHLALEVADFELAEARFSAASQGDAGFAQAFIWASLIRYWLDPQSSQWESLAAQAAGTGATVNLRDAAHLAALGALAARQYDQACANWRALVARSPGDAVGWYALGVCLRRDNTVLNTRGAPRFRASRESAIRAYEQAFRLRPALLNGLGIGTYVDLNELMFTKAGVMQVGVARPDTQTFRAFADWSGDSLAMVPVPAAAAISGSPPVRAPQAVQRQRERLFRLTQLWRTAFPQRPDAAEAMALAMELLGDRRGIDSLRSARRLALTPRDSTRLAALDALIRLKHALPDSTNAIGGALALADSVLAWRTPSDGIEPMLVGSLAAIRGHFELAAAFAAATGKAANTIPQLERPGPVLVALAATGAPRPVLRAAESTVSTIIASLPQAEQSPHRVRWLMLAAALAFPADTLPGVEGALGAAAITHAAVHRDTARVREIVRTNTVARRFSRPTDLALDILFTEATALYAVGLRAEAAAHLDQALEGLPSTNPFQLGQITVAAALTRAASLRALVAGELGDHRASARWTTSATLLKSRTPTTPRAR